MNKVFKMIVSLLEVKMLKKKEILCFIIFIMFLNSCTLDPLKVFKSAGEFPTGNKTISGKLYEDDEVTVVPNATIQITGAVSYITTTAFDGSFSFMNLPEGIYKIKPILSNGFYWTSTLQDLIDLKSEVAINLYRKKYELDYSWVNNNLVKNIIKFKDYNNDDKLIDNVKFFQINEIQGRTHISTYKNMVVTNVIGVVSGFCKNMGQSYDYKQDVYIQSINHDLDYNTSEGLKLYTDNDLNLQIGDIILITTGKVEENYKDPDTYSDSYSGNLSRTQLLCSKNNIIILKKTLNSPQPVIVGIDRPDIPHIVCDNAINGNINNSGRIFDYTKYAIDYWESLEAMYIQIDEPQVVGPTAYSSCYVVPNSSNPASRKYGTNWTANGGLMVKDYSDIHPYIISFAALVHKDDYNWFPKLKVGSKFNSSIKGVLDYQRNNWALYATKDSDVPLSTDNTITKEVTPLTGSGNTMTFGCFNLENFSQVDQYGAPNTNKINGISGNIKTNLNYPDILALVEIQDDSSELDDGTLSSEKTLKALSDTIGNIPTGGQKYQWSYIEPIHNSEGGAPGANIRLAFLFNPVRVKLADGRTKAPKDQALGVINNNGKAYLTYNPGRIDPLNSAFSSTRRVLVGEFIFIPKNEKFYMMGIHISSKIGDGATFGYEQPPQRPSEKKRHLQAKIIRDFVSKILAIENDANIIIAGDFNDYHYSETLRIIKNNILTNAIDLLPKLERYTYNHSGHNQTLDNILLSPNLMKKNPVPDVVRINTDFYYISSSDQPWSDHEPVLCKVDF